MKIKFSKIIWLFVLVVLLHFLAIKFSVYERQMQAGFVWFDNILHFFSGITFAFLWLWIVEHKKIPRRIIDIMIFVLVTAILWELFEFGFLKAFSSQALEYKIYSPTLWEATEDIISNLFGGLILVYGVLNLPKNK